MAFKIAPIANMTQLSVKDAAPTIVRPKASQLGSTPIPAGINGAQLKSNRPSPDQRQNLATLCIFLPMSSCRERQGTGQASEYEAKTLPT